MAVVEPYALCPCGSGQKFKWCCHKVEVYAERSQRLFEGGQADLAVKALDEGLRKEPGNPWLLTRKALYLTRTGQVEPAKAALRIVLDKNPVHAGAQMLMTRLVLETEGPAAGAAQLQRALVAFPPESRSALGGLVKVVGAFLAEAGEFPAAIMHLQLAAVQGAAKGQDTGILNSLRAIEGNPSVSAWLKNHDALSLTPDGLEGPPLDTFEKSLGLASQGLWDSAAAGFESLTSHPVAGRLAERNVGLCRLRLADNTAAYKAFKKSVAGLGTTTEAVDLEALCQQIASPDTEDQVEIVQLVWPLRGRDALLAALGTDRTVHSQGRAPLDPDDEASPEVDQFAFLDRDEVDRATADLTIEDIPRIEGRLYVGLDSVTLETYDDGRLDRLSERLTSLAGTAIPPAHPKTKPMGKVPRLQLALMWEWLLPDEIDDAVSRKLSEAQSAHLIGKIWPETPNPAFRGRTPLQAAQAGDSEVSLRAAVCQFEQARELGRSGIDFQALRTRLRIPSEPVVDPETVDVSTLHLARLGLVPVERLKDEDLIKLYARARKFSIEEAMSRAGHELVRRPEALDRNGLDTLTVYTDLAALAASRNQDNEALDWVKKGRLAEAPSKRASNAASWDIFELRLRTHHDEPSVWVPELAIILDRYQSDPQSNQVLMMNLIEMGLLQVVDNPDRSGEILLDSRPLQSLMSEYGPRVTTASGRLGVSATKPEIWTPGSKGSGGSSGGVWTPGGSTTPPSSSGGESKLIITGR